MTKWQRAILSGAGGACALTLLHEVARRVVPHAPRADVLGMRALDETLRVIGVTPPKSEVLHRWALLGDILSNSLYYSLVGCGSRKGVWRRGVLLGIGAGIGTVVLPTPLGLGRQPDERIPVTPLMTIVWYLVGGLVAAATFSQLTDESESDQVQSDEE